MATTPLQSPLGATKERFFTQTLAITAQPDALGIDPEPRMSVWHARTNRKSQLRARQQSMAGSLCRGLLVRFCITRQVTGSLQIEHIGIAAAALHQFFVRALFVNPAVMQHDDAVHHADGR